MTIHTNSIAIDEIKFKKTSKKLLTKLNSEESGKLKLNKVQELLAQSLGYRNLFELNQFLTQENQSVSAIKQSKDKDNINKKNILMGSDFPEIIRLMETLCVSEKKYVNEEFNDILKVVACMYLLSYMKKENPSCMPDNEFCKQDFSLTYDNILRNLSKGAVDNLDYAVKAVVAKTPHSFFEKSLFLKDFILSVHERNLTSEAIQRQFVYLYQNLYFIENYDFKIYSKEWLLNPNEISSLVQFTSEIYASDSFELSWLDMEGYKDLVRVAMRTKKDSITLSDLIIKITKTINPLKRDNLLFVYNELIRNKQLAKEISEEFMNMTH